MSSEKYAVRYEKPAPKIIPYEDSSFTSGDTGVTHAPFTDLGRKEHAYNGEIDCDGAGDITIQLSNDGTTFDTAITVKAAETLETTGYELHSFKVNHTGTDSAYRSRFW